MTLIRVVFPEPFGPIRMLTLSCTTSRETPSKAWRLPNDLVMLCTDRMFEAMGRMSKKKEGGGVSVYGGLDQVKVSVFWTALGRAGTHVPARTQLELTTFQIWY